MVSEATFTIVQYACTFGMTIVFSMIALERKTILSNLVACLMWLVLALSNFIVGYTVIGTAVSWTFGIVCFIFMGGFIMGVVNSYADYKEQRWELGGY